MVRKKVTISLSSKCLQLIDHYSETTGFESRSRVVEELVFAITELLGNKARYAQNIKQFQKNPISTEEAVRIILEFSDVLSKFDGILNRFMRFAPIPEEKTNGEKKYRYIPPSERKPINEPEKNGG